MIDIPSREEFLRLKNEQPFEQTFFLDGKNGHKYLLYDDAWLRLLADGALRKNSALKKGAILEFDEKEIRPLYDSVENFAQIGQKDGKWEVQSLCRCEHSRGLVESIESSVGAKRGDLVEVAKDARSGPAVLTQLISPRQCAVQRLDVPMFYPQELAANHQVRRLLKPADVAASIAGKVVPADTPEVAVLSEEKLKEIGAIIKRRKMRTVGARIRLLDDAALVANDPERPEFVRWWHSACYQCSSMPHMLQSCGVSYSSVDEYFKRAPLFLYDRLFEATERELDKLPLAMTPAERNECLNSVSYFTDEQLKDERRLDPPRFLSAMLSFERRKKLSEMIRAITKSNKEVEAAFLGSPLEMMDSPFRDTRISLGLAEYEALREMTLRRALAFYGCEAPALGLPRSMPIKKHDLPERLKQCQQAEPSISIKIG